MSVLKPDFIYFDLDDTLLDHKKAELNGLSDVYNHFDVFNDISFEHLHNTYHKINKNLWEQYGRSEIDRHILHRKRFEETFKIIGVAPELYSEAGQVYMSYYRNHWEWIEGAKESFERIVNKFPVGIITNGFAETQWMKIEQFGFKKVTEQIVISEEVGVMKPDQKIFDHATKLADVPRQKILYVGDSLTSDVKGGLSAGWKVAWFKSNPTELMGTLPDLVFDDFAILDTALGL